MSAKDDFDLFASVAEMLGLDEDESENFVGSAMRRRGHRPAINWMDSEEGGGEGGGDFFSKKRERREVGRRPPQRDESRKNAGWQYGA
jgi:hypothetical protein